MMREVYKYSLIVYRTLMIAIIPLAFITKVLVGAAGHNGSFESSDYLLFTFIILTVIILSILNYVPIINTKIRTVLRYLGLVLVVTSIAGGIEMVSEFFIEPTFSAFDIITTGVILLFIFSGLIVAYSLLFNKFITVID